jgi:hypothetical protein
MRNHFGHRPTIVGSIGTRGYFFAAKTDGIKDKRTTDPAKSHQGTIICPECNTLVGLKKATADESGVNGIVSGIRKGDLIIRKHRVGGGAYSMRLGDALCKAVYHPVPKEK